MARMQVAALMLAAMALSGCTTGGSDPQPTSTGTISSDCYPAPMSVSPAPVPAGEGATLSAPSATDDCTLELGDNAEYEIAIVDAAQRVTVTTFTTDVAPDGKFSHRFDIPAGTAPGRYLAIIRGGVDFFCNDVGMGPGMPRAGLDVRPASCVAYGAEFEIVAAR